MTRLRWLCWFILVLAAFVRGNDDQVDGDVQRRVLGEQGINAAELFKEEMEFRKNNLTKNNVGPYLRHDGPTSRIVGGSPVKDLKYPFIGSLQKKGIHICGGTLISRFWVLSAAHCFQYHSWRPTHVVFKQADLSGVKMNQRIRIRRRYVYKFKPSEGNSNDMVLLRLWRPQNGVKPILLNDGVRFEKPGNKAIVAGWGVHYEVAWQPSVQMYEVEVPIVSWENCTRAYSDFDSVPRSALCAGYDDGGKDACQGDSGGPLFVYDAETKNYVQLGIVSWGLGCARPMRYGVYQSVSSQLGFIYRKLRYYHLPRIRRIRNGVISLTRRPTKAPTPYPTKKKKLNGWTMVGRDV